MANDKEPLLSTSLTETQRLNLSAMKQHPGYAVLELMLTEACRRATEDVIKLNPIEEGYERKLKALQSRARDRNEFSLLVLASVDWQSQFSEIEQKSKVVAMEPEQEQNRIAKLINKKVD
jgi:hypothetical protein